MWTWYETYCENVNMALTITTNILSCRLSLKGFLIVFIFWSVVPMDSYPQHTSPLQSHYLDAWDGMGKHLQCWKLRPCKYFFIYCWEFFHMFSQQSGELTVKHQTFWTAPWHLISQGSVAIPPSLHATTSQALNGGHPTVNPKLSLLSKQSEREL